MLVYFVLRQLVLQKYKKQQLTLLIRADIGFFFHCSLPGP